MFWTIAGMIAWGLLTIGILIAALILFADDLPLVACGLVLAFCLSAAGVTVTVINSGWFDDSLPADGCYRLSRSTELMPVSTGKTVTLIPVEDAQFLPIPCPGEASRG